MKYVCFFLTIVLLVLACNQGKDSLIDDNKPFKPLDTGNVLNENIKLSVIRIITYSEDSVLQSELMYDTILKQKEGIAKLYHSNGQLKQQGMWHKDRQEGVWLFYDTVGNIESKVNFKNDSQDGESVFYNSKGIIIEKANWLNGKLDGESLEYYGNGQPKRLTKWKNGQKVSEKKYNIK